MTSLWRYKRHVEIRGDRSPEGVRSLLRMAAMRLGEYVDATSTPFDEQTIGIVRELDKLAEDVL